LITDYMASEGRDKALMEKRYGKKQLQSMVDNLMTETYMTDNTKPCPNCQAPIQKSEGCNKMTCNKYVIDHH
jgi:E3 ubiquitin-protein ligase RNF14